MWYIIYIHVVTIHMYLGTNIFSKYVVDISFTVNSKIFENSMLYLNLTWLEYMFWKNCHQKDFEFTNHFWPILIFRRRAFDVEVYQDLEKSKIIFVLHTGSKEILHIYSSM